MHVTHSRYIPQYHHLPSPLHAGKAPHTVPPGDESVFNALTHLPLTCCFFLSPGLIFTASTATSSTLLCPALSPVLCHMSYHLVAFISTSVAHTPCLVISPPFAICHNARKEDYIEEEACKPGTTCSITTSTSICIENGSCIIATATSYRREHCKAHHPHHVVARLTIGSCLEACIWARVTGRI